MAKKWDPEKRARAEAKRAAAREQYEFEEMLRQEKLGEFDKQRELSQKKLNDLTSYHRDLSNQAIATAQANADVMDMQVSATQKLVDNAQELALLNNADYQTLTKINAINDLAHANKVAMHAHADEINLLEDDSYKRLVKQKVLDDAGAKTLKDELDLRKEKDLLQDEGFKRDTIAQKILADRKSTAQSIAQLAIDQAAKKDETLKAEKETLRILQKQVDRSDELDASLQKFTDFKNDIFEVIQDPKVATGLFLVAWGNELNKLNTRLVEMEGNMKMSRTQALEMGPAMASANIQGFAMGVSAELTQGAMEGMAESMGRVGELTGKQVAQTAQLSKELGIGAKETGNLVGRMMLVEGHTAESAAASLEITANLARGANVPIGKVTKDLADNMDLTSKFANISVAELGEMAVEAAKLGTSLTAISALGDKMMNVDQARNDAMELSVMLGRQVNIDKVQQLMYEGKSTEAYKEMLDQLGGINEFNEMDYFQKKRSADMMGTTVEQLQKELNLAAGLEETGEKKAAGWAKITQKAGDYFGVLKDNSGTVLATMNMFKSLGSNIGAFGAGAKGASGFFGSMKAGIGGMKDKWLGKSKISDIGGGGDGGGGDIPGLKSTTESSDTLSKGPKKGMKDKLSDLADGLKKMGQKGVMKGIGAMALAGPAMLISVLAIPFLAFMGMVPLAMLFTNFKALGSGLQSLGKGFSNVVKGLLVLGLLGVAMIPAALAFRMLKGIDPLAILAFSLGIGVLALAAVGLGMVFPMVLLGSAALAILGLAIIPAAMAMSNLAGVDPAAIIGFAIGLGLLAAAVAGMGFMIIGITLGAIAAKLLGPAIEPAAEALQGIKGVDPAAIIGFGLGLGLLALAVAGMGLMIIPIGLGILGSKLLAKAIGPAAEALQGISGISADSITAFSTGLLSLVKIFAGVGLMLPLIALGAIGIAMLGVPLLALNKALSIMPQDFDMEGFAEGIKQLAVGGLALIPSAIGIGFMAAALSGLAIALLLINPAMFLFTTALVIIGTVVPGIVDGIVRVLDSIKEVIVVISTEIINVITAINGAISNLATQIITVVTTIGDVISTTVSNVGNTISTTIANIANEIIKVIQAIVTGVQTVGSAIVATVTAIANEIIKVITAITVGIQSIGTVIINVITSIASGIAMVIESIANGLSQIVSTIGNAISGIIDSMTGFISMLGSLSPSHIFSIAAGFTVLGMAGLAMGIGAIGVTGMAGALSLLALSLGLLAPLMPVIDKLAQFGLLGDVGIESNVSSTTNKEETVEEKTFDNSILADKLDVLIELMTKGGTVTLDGKKVGRILNNAMGPIGA